MSTSCSPRPDNGRSGLNPARIPKGGNSGCRPFVCIAVSADRCVETCGTERHSAKQVPAGVIAMIWNRLDELSCWFLSAVGLGRRCATSSMCPARAVSARAFPMARSSSTSPARLVMGLIAGIPRVQGRGRAAVAAVRDDRHSRRLHHFLRVFAGCRVDVRAR